MLLLLDFLYLAYAVRSTFVDLIDDAAVCVGAGAQVHHSGAWVLFYINWILVQSLFVTDNLFMTVIKLIFIHLSIRLWKHEIYVTLIVDNKALLQEKLQLPLLPLLFECHYELKKACNYVTNKSLDYKARLNTTIKQ